MNLLLTTASPLAESLASTLAKSHTVTNITPPFNADETTAALFTEVGALVHPVAPLTLTDERAQIDYATRQTYNLLRTLSNNKGSEAGTARAVLISTLDLMDAYDPDYRVDERFRPLPNTEPRLLAAHLAEYTAREFAREHQLTIVVLRVGDVEAAAVARAVDRALTAEVNRWSIFHLAPDVANPRFPIEKAQSQLDWQPI